MKLKQLLVGLITAFAAVLISSNAWAWQYGDVDVNYVDENGDQQNYKGNAYILGGDPVQDAIWDDDGAWYIVDTVNLDDGKLALGPVTVTGNIKLLLKDNAKLTATGVVDKAGICVANGNSLTIYAASVGAKKGELVATGGENAAGIGGGSNGSGGTITINGGKVTAIGGDKGAGIGGGGDAGNGGTVTINGGMVTATGGKLAAGIGGGGDAGNGGTVTINGGMVTATGGDGYGGGSWGAGIGGGCIPGAGTRGDVGTLTVGPGFVVKADKSNPPSTELIPDDTDKIPLNSEQYYTVMPPVKYSVYVSNDSGDTLTELTSGALEIFPSDTPYLYFFCNVGDIVLDAIEFNNTMSEALTITGSAKVEKKDNPSGSYDGVSCWLNVYTEGAGKSGTIQLKSSSSADVYATVPISVLAPVEYLDASGNTKTCEVYKVVKSDTATLDSDYWVVNADVATSGLTVSGNAHLILCDNARLTTAGGDSQAGICVGSGNSLTIYAASVGENMGELVATGGENAAGIGGGDAGNGGTITINGGKVTAIGGDKGAGIGGGEHENGGDVIVNGGFVTANGGAGAMGIGWGADGSQNGTLKIGEGMVAYAGESPDPTAEVSMAGEGNFYIIEKRPPPPLTFTALVDDSSVTFNPNAGTYQISTNGTSWSDYVGNNEIKLAKEGDKVCFRAKGDNSGAYISDYGRKFSTTGRIAASGDVTTLIKKDGTDTIAAFQFNGLFDGCTSLVSAPELPATTLSDACYFNMFKNCSSLIQAPELPATVLAKECYEQMFDGCSSLTNAPALPAQNLAESCYCSMLRGTSITKAPALTAMTLAKKCYYSMFQECGLLKAAPALPATELSESCYSKMFSGCGALTNAPALPATILENGCYQDMFYKCTSLANAPALPATTLAESCYYCMFQSCASLTNLPALSVTVLAAKCYGSMFWGCEALKLSEMEVKGCAAWSIPAGATDADNARYNMFSKTGGDFTGDPEIGKTYYLVTTPPVCKIGNVGYLTIAEAIEAAGDDISRIEILDAGAECPAGFAIQGGNLIRIENCDVISDGVYYTTVKAAVGSVAEGATIQLLRRTLLLSGSTIEFTKNVTIDLSTNKFEISGTLLIDAGKTVTLKSSGGEPRLSLTTKLTIKNTGKLVLPEGMDYSPNELAFLSLGIFDDVEDGAMIVTGAGSYTFSDGLYWKNDNEVFKVDLCEEDMVPLAYESYASIKDMLAVPANPDCPVSLAVQTAAETLAEDIELDLNGYRFEDYPAFNLTIDGCKVTLGDSSGKGYLGKCPVLANDGTLVITGGSYGFDPTEYLAEGYVATKDATLEKWTVGDDPQRIAVTGVALDQTTITVKISDAPVTLTATVTPADATDPSVVWTSSDEKVAMVKDGVVTFVGVGEAVITVTAASDENISATCSVSVFDDSAVIPKVIDDTKSRKIAVEGLNDLVKALPDDVKSLEISVKDVKDDTLSDLIARDKQYENVPEGKVFSVEMFEIVILMDGVTMVSDTPNPLKFTFAYDFTGKSVVNVWRQHGERLDNISEGRENAVDGEYWEGDREGGHITLYLNKFSTIVVSSLEDNGSGPSDDGPSLAYDENEGVPIPTYELNIGSVYQAWLKSDESAESEIVGSVKFTLGKPNRKSGAIKVTAKVFDAVMKKNWTAKGEAIINDDGTLTVQFLKGKSNVLGAVRFQGDSVVGLLKPAVAADKYAVVEGGLFADRKTGAEKLAKVKAIYQGIWSAALDFQDGEVKTAACLAAKVNGAGRVKIQAFDEFGNTYSGSALLSVGKEGWASIPVVLVKKVNGEMKRITFVLWINENGEVAATNEGTIGFISAGTPDESINTSTLKKLAGSMLLSSFDGEWILEKDVDYTGFRLSYLAKSGMVSGSVRIRVGETKSGKPVMKRFTFKGIVFGTNVLGFAFAKGQESILAVTW